MLARTVTMLLLHVAAAAADVGPGGSPGGGPVVDPVEETLFDWQTDRCEDWDIPDAPARVWQDPDGSVRLIAGAERNRLLAGADPDRLERDCRVAHEGARDPDPSRLDGRTWIAAVHPAGPDALMALGHVEHHGHLDTEACPSGRYLSCWYNTIIELRSDDGGATFHRAGGATDLVAALPYRWPGETGQRMGYFNPSNILERDGYLYAFIFAEAFRGQTRGPCLIRRPVAGGAADWRAWDGRDFAVRFVDPWTVEPDTPSDHVCTPVRGIATTISTVVRHAPTGLFIALTPAAPSSGPPGIWWSVSRNLTDWAAPRLLHPVPLLWRRDCAATAAYAYPGMFDGDSPQGLAAVVDGTAWLTLTRMALDANCRVGAERDLVRLRVTWPDALLP